MMMIEESQQTDVAMIEEGEEVLEGDGFQSRVWSRNVGVIN